LIYFDKKSDYANEVSKNSFITFTQKIKSVRFNILQNALT